jgi:hypothetical protein
MPLSVFTRMTQLVTVRELCTPLQPPLRHDMTLAACIDAIDQFGHGESTRVSLVNKDQRTIGWVQYWDLREENIDLAEPVTTVMSEPQHSNLITANATSIQAVRAFVGQHYEFLFVLDGTDIVGTLFFRDFFKPAFKLCLLALTLEVERRSLQLCMTQPAKSWSALSDGRRQKIIEMCGDKRSRQRKRRGGEPLASIPGMLKREQERLANPLVLLENTFFSDKKTIIKKCHLLPGMDSKVLDKFYDLAECIRNAIAHPESSDDAFFEEPGELWGFVENCHAVLREIEKVHPKEPDDWCQPS